MDQDQDFSKLRNLLALKKLDMPSDTQIDQVLIEFHRRQLPRVTAAPPVDETAEGEDASDAEDGVEPGVHAGLPPCSYSSRRSNE